MLKQNNTPEIFQFNAIGIVNSPYKEKFAIPRQPRLVTAAVGHVELINDANNVELVRGLSDFSHIWLMFVFHGTMDKGWKPLVRPPRLGGNKKTGVLATRSTFRPNPIGMSAVKLENIYQKDKKVILEISGLDLLDNTPILDIKPYIPYADSISNANADFAQQAPKAALTAEFSVSAQQSLDDIKSEYPQLGAFIRQILAQDPRPAYKQNKRDENIYGMQLYSFNIRWQINENNLITVLTISDETHTK